MPTNKDKVPKKKKVETAVEESHEELVEMAEDIVDETEENVRQTREAEEAEQTADETIDETSGFNEAGDRKKIHIEFPYSELVRAKVPKAFEVAENVAEEWVNDGNFENIPVGHPLAQITVAAGLRKAKEVEKKLEEKGVFAMAKMGLEYAKMKINKK